MTKDRDRDCSEREVEVQTIEVAEKDIYAYLYDENDKEIGFSVLDDDGEEIKYFYPRSKSKSSASLSADEIKQATGDLNDIYKEGRDVLGDLKDAVLDIQSSFKEIVKKS